MHYSLNTKLLIIKPPMANAVANLSGRNSSYQGDNDVPTPATSSKTIANIIGFFLPYLKKENVKITINYSSNYYSSRYTY